MSEPMPVVTTTRDDWLFTVTDGVLLLAAKARVVRLGEEIWVNHPDGRSVHVCEPGHRSSLAAWLDRDRDKAGSATRRET